MATAKKNNVGATAAQWNEVRAVMNTMLEGFKEMRADSKFWFPIGIDSVTATAQIGPVQLSITLSGPPPGRNKTNDSTPT